MNVTLLAGSLSVVGLGLVYAFSNGFRDSSTIVATVVSTRALSPDRAFLICALSQFVGALVFGSAVALTIGRGMFGQVLNKPPSEIVITLVSALAATIIWGAVSWWRAWPTSNNQALFAGLTGGGLAMWGWGNFRQSLVLTIFLVLILSPILGFLVSMILTRTARFLGEWMTPKVLPVTRILHIFSCVILSFGHGSNDGQIVMGILVLALGFYQIWTPSSGGGATVPLFVRMLVAVALGGGVLLGGKRILRKLGMSFYRIRPPQGFCADTSSALTIFLCTIFGFPASTVQVITGSIAGAGAAKNIGAVRWRIAEEIAFSWVLTLPTVALLAAFLSELIQHLVRFS